MIERTITLSAVILDGDEYLDLEIHENELAGISDQDLKKWGISRKTLHRCFAEGLELMKSYTERDRMRPLAEHTGDGPDAWEVFICGYSPFTDPLMPARQRATPDPFR